MVFHLNANVARIVRNIGFQISSRAIVIKLKRFIKLNDATVDSDNR